MKSQHLHVCPQCGRTVGPEHFACVRAAKAGEAGHGKAKARGNAEYYRALVAKRKDRQPTGPNTGVCRGTPSAERAGSGGELCWVKGRVNPPPFPWVKGRVAAGL